MKKVDRVKKAKKSFDEAVVSVVSSFNNTVITAADRGGNTIAWSSSGLVGFKGARKSTPFAAQMAAEDLSRKMKAMGVTTISVKMKGAGSGREAVLRSMHGFTVTKIIERTPIPHNGPREPRRRRG
jgi:small subunit ribosomal protein S11